MVGAILVQQTAWENVVKVIDDMKDRGVLDVDVMATMLQEELEEIVRPAGFYRQKSARLQHLAQHIQKITHLILENVAWTDEGREEGITITSRHRRRDLRCHSCCSAVDIQSSSPPHISNASSAA